MNDLHTLDLTTVYWLELQPDSALRTQFLTCQPYILSLNSLYEVVEDQLLCKLYFDGEATHMDYEKLWQEIMEGTEHDICILDIYCSTAILAAAANLTPELLSWCPADPDLGPTSLMVTANHQKKELG